MSIRRIGDFLSMDPPDSFRNIQIQYHESEHIESLLPLDTRIGDTSVFVIFMDTTYGSSQIRRIGNWSNALSCEVLALIRRISFVGYG
ncbi:hypothetical protein Tco_0853424, partial [Tanacetum coccineum]